MTSPTSFFMFSLPFFIEQVFAECLLCATDSNRFYKYTHTHACMHNRKLLITCSLTIPNNLYFMSYKLSLNVRMYTDTDDRYGYITPINRCPWYRIRILAHRTKSLKSLQWSYRSWETGKSTVWHLRTQKLPTEEGERWKAEGKEPFKCQSLNMEEPGIWGSEARERCSVAEGRSRWRLPPAFLSSLVPQLTEGWLFLTQFADLPVKQTLMSLKHPHRRMFYHFPVTPHYTEGDTQN